MVPQVCPCCGFITPKSLSPPDFFSLATNIAQYCVSYLKYVLKHCRFVFSQLLGLYLTSHWARRLAIFVLFCFVSINARSLSGRRLRNLLRRKKIFLYCNFFSIQFHDIIVMSLLWYFFFFYNLLVWNVYLSFGVRVLVSTGINPETNGV